MESGKLIDVIQDGFQRERKEFEDTGKLESVFLCHKVRGGPLDYPGAISRAVADVASGWEEHFQALFVHRIGNKGSSLDMNSIRASVDDAGSTASIAAMGDSVANRSRSSRSGVASEADLASVVAQSCHMAEEHLSLLAKDASERGILDALPLVLGGAVLLRNTLWCYEDFCKGSDDTTGKGDGIFKPSYRLMCGLADGVAEQLLEAQSARVATCVLASPDCQQWDDPRPFFEGERGSYALQMWWTHMQGLRQDLSGALPPKISQRLLTAILNESLSILTSRYCRAYPSQHRWPQYVNDLVDLLWCCGDLLLCCSSSMRQLGGRDDGVGREGNKALAAVHAKCDLLFAFLALLGPSLGAVCKSFQKGVSESVLTHRPDRRPTYPPWLTILRPELFRTQPDGQLTPEADLYLETALLEAQPEPLWALMIKVLMSHGAMLTKLILSTLAERQCDQCCVTMSNEVPSPRCSRYMCGDGGGVCVVKEKCLCHTVCSALMYLLVHTQKRREVVQAVVRPVLGQVKDWSILDKSQVWNTRRPSWYRALTDLVEPYLEAGILGLVLDEEWSEERDTDVPRAVTALMSSLGEAAPSLPPLLPHLLALLDDLAPPDVKPLGGSCGVQVMASSLYSLLNDMGRVEELVGAALGEGDKDLLIAVAERLCHLDAEVGLGEQMQEVRRQLRMGAEEANWEEIHFEDLSSDDPEAMSIAEVMADWVLSEERGKMAMQTLHWFLVSNLAWVREALGLTSAGHRGSSGTMLHLHVEKAKAPTLQMYQWIGDRHFNEVLAGTFQVDWPLILQTKMGLSKDFVQRVIQHRWELHGDAQLNKSDQEMLQTLMASVGEE